MNNTLQFILVCLHCPVTTMNRYVNKSIRSLGIDVLNTGTTVMYYPIIGQQNVYTVYGEKSESISS